MGKKFYIKPSLKFVDDQIDKTGNISGVPTASKAFLPIIIPIVLIVFRSLAELPSLPFGEGRTKELLDFIGNPVVALFIGMLISFTLPRKFDKEMLSATGWVGEALKSAAIIILVTGAGGAFGKIMQGSGLGSLLEQNVGASGFGIWFPFLVAAILKTAQGSSTVALITTASLVAPLLPALGLDSELSKAMAVIAIGAGSAVVSHANDSFFWVVTQMSGMDIRQGYRLLSLGSGVLGFSAIIVLTILSFIIK